MKRLCVAIVLSAISAALQATPIASDLYGRWRVLGVADAQETTSMSSNDAEKLVGTDFVIAADLVQFGDEVCQHPRFTATRHRTRLMFRRDYRFEPKNMGLPDPVTQIEVNCKNPVIYFIYIKRQNAIIFYWKGFFLNAARQRGKSQREGEAAGFSKFPLPAKNIQH